MKSKKLQKKVDRRLKKKKEPSTIKESIARLVDNIISDKSETAKFTLKGIVERKLKQKIINNYTTNLF